MAGRGRVEKKPNGAYYGNDLKGFLDPVTIDEGGFDFDYFTEIPLDGSETYVRMKIWVLPSNEITNADVVFSEDGNAMLMIFDDGRYLEFVRPGDEC